MDIFGSIRSRPPRRCELFHSLQLYIPIFEEAPSYCPSVEYGKLITSSNPRNRELLNGRGIYGPRSRRQVYDHVECRSILKRTTHGAVCRCDAYLLAIRTRLP